MKRKVLLTAAGVAVALAAGVLLVLLAGVNALRPQIESQLEHRLGREVRLGEMGLKIFPLAVRVRDVAVEELPEIDTEHPFVTAREVRVRANLRALLSRRIEVASLALEEPSVELVRTADGTWNYAKMPPGRGAAPGEPGSENTVTFAEITIRKGRIGVSGLGSGQPRVVYENIDLKLRDFGPGRTYGIEAAVELPEAGGKVAVEGQGGPAAGEFDGVVTLTGGRFGAVSLAEPVKATCRVSSERGGAGKRTASGNVRTGEVRLENLALKGVAADWALEGGLMRLVPVKSEVAGGALSGAVTVDTEPKTPSVAANLKLEGVDAAELLSAVTALKGVLSGRLAADMQTRFLAVEGDKLARTLDGTVGFRLTDGVLHGMDLLREMAVIGKFLGAVPQKRDMTRLVGMSGTMKIEKGVARTDDLRLEIEGGVVGAAGEVNLADRSLNLLLTAVLAREYSQSVGGTKVGGYLETVLGNDQGELVIPARLAGTFEAPRFAPDPERLARMKLKQLVPSTSNLGQLTSKVLGAIQGKAPEKQESGEEKKAVESILDIFRQRQEEKGKAPE